MLTGVIYAAIVVAWAAYLVPLALRRHDEATRSRSIERFSSAMRVLSRRSTHSAGRVVLAPRRSVRRLIGPNTKATGGLPPAPVPGVSLRRRHDRQASAAAASRRRRVLAVLLSLTLVTVVVAVFALVPWWSVAVPVALIVGFLLAARRSVRQSSDAYWEQELGAAEEAEPEPSNVLRRRATRVDATHGVDHAVGTDDEETVALDGTALAAAGDVQRHVAMPVQSSDGGSMWDPLPVTLPTYVDKPVARRTVRKIDLNGPETFSAGHLDEDAALAEEHDSSPSSSEDAAEAVPDKKVVNG